MYLLRHRCEYTTGFLERGCGREADKARGVAECLIRLRDHIRVQEIPWYTSVYSALIGL